MRGFRRLGEPLFARGLASRLRLGTRAVAGGGDTVAPPAQPTGLTATPVSTSQINLAWTDAATTETAYKVYRSTDGVNYAQVGTDLAAGTQAYNDTPITAGTHYYYKVAAVNAGGETLSAAATANTLTYGLVSYWTLNETSGTRADSLGTNALIVTAGAPVSGAGIIGNGAQGDGSGLLGKNPTSSYNMQTSGFSAWGWIYVTNFTGRKGIFQNSTTQDFSITVESSATIVLNVNDSTSGASQAIKGSLSLQTNTWYFIWGRYDKDTKKAEVGYNAVAGTLGSALTNGAKSITSMGILRGGATINNNAVVDEIGCMLRKIEDSELSALYAGGAGLTYPF